MTLFLLFGGHPAHAQAGRISLSEQILQPSGETSEHDTFGTAVAISGNTMAIGAVNADGNEIGAGAVYIFERMNDNWVQTAKLFAADGRAEPVPQFPGDFRSDSFGSTVAISGDTVIAGAPFHGHPGLPLNSGAVYVFQRVNGVWSQQAELFAPFPNNQDEVGAGGGFGGIAVSGNTIAVTEQGNAIGTIPGSVDVFTLTNNTWTLTTQLTVPDDFFFFPSSLAFDGSNLVVGSSISDAPGAFSAGVAYLFRFNKGQWSMPVKVAANDATPGAQFGSSVGLSNNLLVVCSLTPGAAYVFAGEEGAWRQKARLIPSDGMDSDAFGFSVSVSGHALIVGAPSHTPASSAVPAAGSAYVFEEKDDNWMQIAELSASDGISGGDFGTSVAVMNNTLLVGADFQHPLVEGYPGGEAYVFRLDR
jgi:hypothetical protein